MNVRQLLDALGYDSPDVDENIRGALRELLVLRGPLMRYGPDEYKCIRCHTHVTNVHHDKHPLCLKCWVELKDLNTSALDSGSSQG